MEQTRIPGDITQLLASWKQGGRDILAELIPMAYEELRQLARAYLRKERVDHTLQPTALVHEVYLRIAGLTHPRWRDRRHFYGIAARLMRQILVDHARANGAAKRGGGQPHMSLEHVPAMAAQDSVDLPALDVALQKLAESYPRQSEVVEMRFFGGLSVTEIAAALDISEKTVVRDWTFAKLWLCRELNRVAYAE